MKGYCWVSKSSLDFNLQRQLTLCISFETRDLLCDRDPGGSIGAQDLCKADCSVSWRWSLMNVLEELGMVRVHGMESTAFDQIECQSSSLERIDRFQFSCCAAQQVLLAVFDDKRRLVDGNLFVWFLLHQFLPPCRELLRSQVHQTVLLEHIQNQVIGGVAALLFSFQPQAFQFGALILDPVVALCWGHLGLHLLLSAMNFVLQFGGEESLSLEDEPFDRGVSALIWRSSAPEEVVDLLVGRCFSRRAACKSESGQGVYAIVNQGIDFLVGQIDL